MHTKFYHNRSGFVDCISKNILVCFFGSQCRTSGVFELYHCTRVECYSAVASLTGSIINVRLPLLMETDSLAAM